MSKFCTNVLAREAGLPVHRFPITSEEGAIAENALAQALNKLSLDEQERIIFDVHGMATTPHEGEKSVDAFLKALEKEIDKISPKDAYDHALFLNPSFVSDPTFRLMFLRALEFNAAAAADMMVKHFETKRELFGNGEILAREVHQSDLSPRDLELLKQGLFQVLPLRDASGRTVMCMMSDLNNVKMHELGRPTFYATMALLRDEEVQKLGTVWVGYNKGNVRIDFSEYFECNRIQATLPIRSSCGHFCSTSYALRPLAAGFQLFVNSYDRVRMRSHFGTLQSMHFTLQTYGIPTDVSPMKNDGTWSTEYHMEWLRAQKVYEEGDATKKERVVIPRKFDVLFGKCARARLSTGTQRALHLVEMYREQYENASKYEKTDLALKILTTIQESNGRFLKQDEEKGGWIVVDEASARKKVAHWFRFKRSKLKSQGDDHSGESVSNTSSKARAEREEEDTSMVARPTKRVSPGPLPLVPKAGEFDHEMIVPSSGSSSSASIGHRIVSGIVKIILHPMKRGAPDRDVVSSALDHESCPLAFVHGVRTVQWTK